MWYRIAQINPNDKTKIDNLIKKMELKPGQAMGKDDLEKIKNNILSQNPDLFKNSINLQYFNASYNLLNAKFKSYDSKTQQPWYDPQGFMNMNSHAKPGHIIRNSEQTYQKYINKYRNLVQQKQTQQATDLFNMAMKDLNLEYRHKEAFRAQAQRIRMEILGHN